MSNRCRNGLNGVAWMIAACGLALPAVAQNAPEATRPDGPPPVLEGPKATRVRPPGVGGDFGGGEKMGKDRVARRPAPMRAFWDAVQVLDREDTPDALRLSPEQHKQFEALMGEQRAKMRGEMEARMKERGANSQGRGPGNRPANGPDGRPERGPDANPQAGPNGGRGPEARGPRPDMTEDERRAMREERERARGAGQERNDDRGPDARPQGGPAGRPAQGEGRGRGPEDRPRGPEGRPPRGPEGEGREMRRGPDGQGIAGPNEPAPGAPGEGRKGVRRLGPPQGEPGQMMEQGRGADRAPGADMQEVQTRAWSILNEAQRVLVRQELDRIETEMLDSTMDQRVDQYLKKRRDGAAQGGAAPEGGFADKAKQNPERRAEIAKKLSEMTPEEREAAVQKLRREMRRERGEPKPAPPVEKLRDPE